jgi:uncharacterized protein
MFGDHQEDGKFAGLDLTDRVPAICVLVFSHETLTVGMRFASHVEEDDEYMKMNKPLISFFQALGISFVGGLLFSVFHIPLPWLLGPLFAVSVWQITTKKSLYMPPSIFKMALLLLGYTLGSSFTKDTAIQVMYQFPFMAVATILTLLISMGLGLLTARYAKLDKESVIVGSVPGGLSQMLVISQEMKGINLTVVVFLQVIRLLSVVLLVPFLTVYGIEGDSVHAQFPLPSSDSEGLDGNWKQYLFYGIVSIVGYLIGKRIGIPNSVLTGPLVIMAFISIMTEEQAPSLPPMIIVLSQLAMGINLGLRVQPQMLGNMKKFGIYSISGSVLLVFSSLLIAYGLTVVGSMKLSTAFLGIAPGGIAEMGMTAAVVRADLSMVSAYQLFRLLFILFFVTPLLQRWIKKNQNKRSAIEQNRSTS